MFPDERALHDDVPPPEGEHSSQFGEIKVTPVEYWRLARV